MRAPGIPSKKKQSFAVKPALRMYLRKFTRETSLPVKYSDLMRFNNTASLIDANGEDTLWETAYYSESDRKELHLALTQIYALLKTDGNIEVLEHLSVARIDWCSFGNTHPFRIRIINRYNDNYDHFYVKKADASRIYGLELEHILSPERITYMVDQETLIEEHIAGIPGDRFVAHNLEVPKFDQTRISKEFVKFNERCFVRLLGDMRSYNYVVDVTPDIEGNQYRIRAIDFDQQSYEGRKSFYLPQYFKENNPIITMGMTLMDPDTVTQYQLEERTLIANRAKAGSARLRMLLDVMCKDKISSPDKINKLKSELSEHHKTDTFSACKNMGDIVQANINLITNKVFTQSMGNPNLL